MGRERLTEWLAQIEYNAIEASKMVEDLFKELRDLEEQSEIDGETNASIINDLRTEIAELKNEVESKTRMIDDMARKYNHSFI